MAAPRSAKLARALDWIQQTLVNLHRAIGAPGRAFSMHTLRRALMYTLLAAALTLYCIPRFAVEGGGWRRALRERRGHEAVPSKTKSFEDWGGPDPSMVPFRYTR